MNYLNLNKDYLISSIYKLLPIYEGKTMDSDELLPSEVSLSNFHKNVNRLLLNFTGLSREFNNIKQFQDIVLLLNAIKNVDENSKDIVKKTVFFCINLIKKIDFEKIK